MRTTGMLGGLALMLGLAMPVAAEPPNMALAASETVQAAPEMLLAKYDGMGSGGNHPGMRAAGRPGGWQRAFGHSRRHHRPSFVGMVLMNREQLGLTAQQVDSLRKLGMDSRRAAIRRQADLQTAKLDLMSLRWSEPVDMGKVEVKVREMEKLKGDGMIEAFRTADAAKAQLTAEQREKLKSLRAARWQRRGSGEGGGMDAPDSDRMR
jgi:Spy/CpxP family protein refolding chaperone